MPFFYVLPSHTATVTKDMLLRLFSHSMELKIWDTKDRVSPRARFDRPKAFRIPASRGSEDQESSSGGGVRQIVLSQEQSFENTQPKQSRIVPGDQTLILFYYCALPEDILSVLLPPTLIEVFWKFGRG